MLQCKANTIPIEFWCTRCAFRLLLNVFSVVLRPKKLEIREKKLWKLNKSRKKKPQILCHEISPAYGGYMSISLQWFDVQELALHIISSWVKIDELISQGFLQSRLMAVFPKFYGSYSDLTVADPEISNGWGAPKRGAHSRNNRKNTVFGSQILSFTNNIW
jgi:hypothetical protein